MLTADQIETYRRDGFLRVEGALNAEELARLQRITDRLIDASRSVTQSNDIYDLDEGHSANAPRLTRIKLPHLQDPAFWEIAVNSRLTDILRQLLGENVLLQTSKLNTKAPGGGAAVEWHQDWAFYPHTNDDLLAFGVMLEDVDEKNGPLQVIPGSHRGPVLSHQNGEGVFCGAVDPDDPAFEGEKAVTLTGKAGDMTIHHVRALHGSAPNTSDRARKILFYECAAADAWPLMGGSAYIQRLEQGAQWQDVQDRMICGTPVLEPRLEQVPVRLPYPPPADNSSIFKLQQSGGAKSAFG